MNSLIENGRIKEMLCGANFSYILQDNNSFLSTEYKVLQSQVNSCFVKCMKMNYNGKIQLYYMVKDLKSFTSLIPTLNSANFMTLTANFFSDIIDVKHNGFLSCQNIDISFERIYVDPATYKVSLVYLPLNERLFDDNSHFENEVRTSLVRLIAKTPSFSSAKMQQLSADLSDGTLTLEDILSRIKGGTAKGGPQASEKDPGKSVIRIVAMNAPERVEFLVTKDNYLFGKNSATVDGVITYNRMVSRIHCRINTLGGACTITDLQSANGTFVNRTRLQPNVPHSIKNGDVIRMANSDFQVIIT